MYQNNQIIKMARLCKLLKNSTGLEKEFILKTLDISDRTFTRYLEELRTIGAEISYAKISNTYTIKNSFDVLEYCANELI